MKKNTGKTAAAAVALLAAASITTGSLFDSPAALLREDGGNAVVYQIDAGADDGDGAEPEEDGSEESRRRGGLRALLRRRVLCLPLAVRLLVVLPLWGLGSVLLASFGAVWTLTAPLLGKLAGFALLLALLAGSFAVAAKAVFPDLPLKKLFSRRSLIALVLGAAGLTALDAVLGAAWADYAPVKNAVLAAGFFLALSCALVPAVLREQRRRLDARAEEKRLAAEREAEQPKVLTFTDGVGSFTVRLP